MSMVENGQVNKVVAEQRASFFERSLMWLVLGIALAALCTVATFRAGPSREQANVLVSAAQVLHSLRPTPHDASPLLAYLACPIRFISGQLHGHGILLYQLLIMLIALFSSLVCWKMIASIPGLENRITRGAITLCILAVYLMEPLRLAHYNGFGASQTLLLMLTLPYLLVRAGNRRPLDWPTAWLLGGMAAVGFMIQPGFVVAWVILEVYVALTQRSSRPWGDRQFKVAAGGIVVLGAATFLASPTTVLFTGAGPSLRAFFATPLIDAPSSVLGAIKLILILLVFGQGRLVTGPVRTLSVAALGFLVASCFSPAAGDIQYYAVNGMAILILVLVAACSLIQSDHSPQERENSAAGADGKREGMISVLKPAAGLAGVVVLLWVVGKQRGFPFMDAIAIPDLTPSKCIGIYALVRMLQSGISKGAETLVLRALLLGLAGYTGAEIVRTAQHGLAPNSALILFALATTLVFAGQARISGALNRRWAGGASILLLVGLMVTAGEAAHFGIRAPAPAAHPRGAGRSLVAARVDAEKGSGGSLQDARAPQHNAPASRRNPEIAKFRLHLCFNSLGNNRNI